MPPARHGSAAGDSVEMQSLAPKARRAAVAKASKFSIRPLSIRRSRPSPAGRRALRPHPAKLVPVNPKPPPATPNALSIDAALRASAPLAKLRESLRDSNARFDAVRAAIPSPMRVHVKPGPVDAEGWSLLAANSAVAAKLRQLAPRFEALLRAGGWTACTVRIKVPSTSAGTSSA